MNTPLGTAARRPDAADACTITAPATGAQVSDIVTVTADADDNVGVAGVQFFVDGVATGVEDTTRPYALAWDTRTVTNGAHTLTARARDAAGNVDRCPRRSRVNVANTNSLPERDPRDRASTCRRRWSSCPTAACSWPSWPGRIKRAPAAVHARRSRRRSCSSPTSARRACSRASTTSRSTRTSPPTTTTTSSTRSARRTGTGCRASPPTPRCTGTVAGQRARPLPGPAGRQRRAPRRRDQVRQRRQALLHDRRALQRRRSRRT